MTAALGTLPFLATLWLLVVVGAQVLEESGAKIAAALKGQPVQPPSLQTGQIRMRLRKPAGSRRTIAEKPWRAAA
jgi:hypothetical protein